MICHLFPHSLSYCLCIHSLTKAALLSPYADNTLVTHLVENVASSYGSAVGIAIRYGLDGQGIESRWKARFAAPCQAGPGAHSASYTMGKECLSGSKAAEAWRGADHPPLPRAEIEERVELYLYPPLGLHGLF